MLPLAVGERIGPCNSALSHASVNRHECSHCRMTVASHIWNILNVHEIDHVVPCEGSKHKGKLRWDVLRPASKDKLHPIGGRRRSDRLDMEILLGWKLDSIRPPIIGSDVRRIWSLLKMFFPQSTCRVRRCNMQPDEIRARFESSPRASFR